MATLYYFSSIFAVAIVALCINYTVSNFKSLERSTRGQVRLREKNNLLRIKKLLLRSNQADSKASGVGMYPSNGEGRRDYGEINIYSQQQQQQQQKVGVLDKDKQPTSKVRQPCD
uniref:Uncharacterized protein n=1 Tax=Glossina palpalis gambiensis TaxID=67801 RepID=A0A1B0C2N4_9MUSC